MCFSCSFALLGFGLSRAGGREKKILNPRCPSWTHSRPAAPWIPGVQVGHIPGRQLPGSLVSKLDTFPAGGTQDPWCPSWTMTQPANIGHLIAGLPGMVAL